MFILIIILMEINDKRISLQEIQLKMKLIENLHNKAAPYSCSEDLQSDSFRVSQINFSSNNTHSLPKRYLQPKNKNLSHPQVRQIQPPFQIIQTDKPHRRQIKQPNLLFGSSSVLPQKVKAYVPKSVTEPAQGQTPEKMKQFYLQKQLQQRAKQFVEKVSQQKRQIQGRFFILKQQEQQKRSLKEELQECENNLIRSYYRLQRKSEAQQNIRRIKQQTKQRQRKSLSKKKMRNKDIHMSKAKGSHKKTTALLNNEQKCSFSGSKETRGVKERTQPFLLSNQYYLSDEDRQITLLKKRLLQLKYLMKREQNIKANNSELDIKDIKI